jgi:hypothetical protein
MQFNFIGDVLVVSGSVMGDEPARLKDNFATDRVKLVLLHNSDQDEGSDAAQGSRAGQVEDRGVGA